LNLGKSQLILLAKRPGRFSRRNGWSADNGSFSQIGRSEVGPVYQTSIAVIILSVPAHYLPIFQR
jgi:hypothetical protein